MFGKEHESRAMSRMTEQYRQKTAWIAQVIRRNIFPVPSGATVCCLAVGRTMEELLHVRDITGKQAKIFAFDITTPSPIGEMLMTATGTHYHIHSIQDSDGIVRVMGKMPNLVVCRHPRIIETVNKSGQVLSVNAWWIDALKQWGMKVKGKGQLFITLFTEDEQRMVIRGMNKSSLKPIVGKNLFAPRALRKHFGSKIALPDGYTLLIK